MHDLNERNSPTIPKPHTYRLSGGFFLAYVGLLLACIIVVIGLTMSFSGVVVDEFGRPLGSEAMQTDILIAIVSITWLGSFVVLTRQLFVHRSAFRTSKEGLHDVTVGGIFLAFIIIIPIRFIPWEAVVIDSHSPFPSFRIRKEFYRDFPFMTRLILRLYGLRLSFFYARVDKVWTEYFVDQIQSDLETEASHRPST
jgi:hypothetical protein